MKIIDIRKALSMNQTEFAEYFGRSQNWSTRMDPVDSDELYDVLSGRQWETLQKFKEKAEEIMKVRAR